ncbi:Undefined function [Listeria monocytogenes N53-1]|nr:Undefined function [Listeria monocytogenes]CCQ23749.1 Undefined function [Listeria monocytogenes N53-1]
MKIRIIGSVGSGKTKSIILKQIALSGNEKVRRTDNEKIAVLNKILQQENWIIEGVHLEAWVDESIYLKNKSASNLLSAKLNSYYD